MWKNLTCVLAVVAVTLFPASCQAQADGKPLGPTGVSTSTSRSCQPGDMGPVCADCNTLLTCVDTYEINRQPCTSISSQRPYCEENACKASTKGLCISKTFKCTGSGQYPDPHDCTRYFFCDKVGGKAYAYECPLNFTYDSKSGLCQSKHCEMLDCTYTPNEYVPYPGDPSILAYCLNIAEKKEIIMFRCADKDHMRYDKTTLKCTYECKDEGRFEDKLDCHSFYECYRNGHALEGRHQTCPTGYSYDQVEQICIKRATCESDIVEEENGESGGGPIELFFY